MEQATILYERTGKVCWVTLNRPRVLNSLSLDMIHSLYDQMKQWANDPDVALVILKGAGQKGLCAGGDIRALYDRGKGGDKSLARQFFSTEYALDRTIHEFPKPMLVYMDGIVMGGGVGLATGCSHRVVTEKTKWAMPEANIGFFPDVGASYFLNKMPGATGRYLSMTSTVISGSDAIYSGMADYYLPSEQWEGLTKAIRTQQWTAETAAAELDRLLEVHCTPPPAPALAEKQAAIDRHFGHDTAEAIVASLQEAADEGDTWANETKSKLLAKAPTSLKVMLEQLRQGVGKSLAECLAMELNIALNFMTHDDFYEGVRAVLVDKDNRPVWQPASLGAVSKDKVASFFAPVDAGNYR